MAQFARPDSDVATTGWLTADLWDNVDEGAPGEGTYTATTADFIQSATGGVDVAKLGLSNVTDPAVSTGHILRARWRKNATSGKTLEAKLELRQGVTLIATLSAVNLDADTTSTYTLSTAETDSITDYPALEAWVFAVWTGGGGGRRLEIDFVELETPDAGGGGPTTFFQTVAATSTMTPALTRLSSFKRTLAAVSTMAPVVVTRSAFKRILAAASTMTAALSSRSVKLVVLAATSTMSVAMSTTITFKRALAAASTMTAALTKTTRYKRTLAAASTMVAVLTRMITYKRTLAVASTMAPTLTTVQRVITQVTLAATSVMTASMNQVKVVTIGVAGLAARIYRGAKERIS